METVSETGRIGYIPWNMLHHSFIYLSGDTYRPTPYTKLWWSMSKGIETIQPISDTLAMRGGRPMIVGGGQVEPVGRARFIKA